MRRRRTCGLHAYRLILLCLPLLEFDCHVLGNKDWLVSDRDSWSTFPLTRIASSIFSLISMLHADGAEYDCPISRAGFDRSRDRLIHLIIWLVFCSFSPMYLRLTWGQWVGMMTTSWTLNVISKTFSSHCHIIEYTVGPALPPLVKLQVILRLTLVMDIDYLLLPYTSSSMNTNFLNNFPRRCKPLSQILLLYRLLGEL